MLCCMNREFFRCVQTSKKEFLEDINCKNKIKMEVKNQ